MRLHDILDKMDRRIDALAEERFKKLAEENFTAPELMAAAPEWMFEGKIKLIDKSRPPVWLVMGGRGAGKTRLGAEWVNCLVHGYAPFARIDKSTPIALGRRDHR